MYILVVHVEGEVTVRFVMRYMKQARRVLKRQEEIWVGRTVHWRIWNNGWVDSSPDAYKFIQQAEGQAQIILYQYLFKGMSSRFALD